MARPSRAGPAPASSRRRERRVQPPRPPNAWILYRSFKFEEIRQTNERVSQANVSKRISGMWRNETEDVKRHFERMADDKKAEHQRLYPGYRFSPRKREPKVRARGCEKNHQANKSDGPDATPTNTGAHAGVGASANATADLLPPLSMPYLPQPHLVPGCQQNMVLPHSYIVQYLPQVCYGPGGPSPPISAAPSPASYEGSESSETLSYPEGNTASPSSSPPGRLSPSADSQVSSSSSHLHMSYLSAPSGLDHPSPNPYAVQPPPTLFQSGELSRVSPQVQLPSAEKTFVPAAPVFSNQLSNLDPRNLEEVVNFDIPVNETQQFTPFPQGPHGSQSLEESLQGMLSGTDKNGVWHMSVVEDSELVAQPEGDLEIAVASQDSTVDHNSSERYSDFDFAQFQQRMTSSTQSIASSAAVNSPSVQEELQALFHIPNNANVEAHSTALRQPSAFTQSMMDFFDFEAVEGFHEDSSTVSPPPVPATVAPQQVCLQSSQHAAAMPIFTQMTNTPVAAPCTSYVPPTGAIYSSMRRAGGSWKPPFATSFSQLEELTPSWTHSAK